MESASIFHRFDAHHQKEVLPEQFTFPFYYTPHPLVKEAARLLQEQLSNRDFKHNFGLVEGQEGMIIGKMFGVLVVRNKQGMLGYLSAFSGKLGDQNHHAGFVPPVFDMLHAGSYFKEEEEQLNAINAQIEAIEQGKDWQNATEAWRIATESAEKEIEQHKKTIALAKKQRAEKRIELNRNLTGDALSKALNQLSEESKREQIALKGLKRLWKQRIEERKKALEGLTAELNRWKSERKKRSAALQQRLFEDYHFANAKGENKSLLAIFKQDLGIMPPAGSGECAAPKLLQFAFLNEYEPIALGEFWWGASPKSQVRVHRNFYPACRSKCEPILGHMLQGLLVEPNPMKDNPANGKEYSTVYEDDDLLVLNKPAEFLSVPGKSILDSIETRLQKRYPHLSGPFLVHRLDMSTSGLLLAAKKRQCTKSFSVNF